MGAATPDGYTLDKQPTLRYTVGFKWSYRDESTNESLTKRVRYDYYLSTDLWYDGQERPRKRIRAHLPVGHLADLATKHDRALNALVARANFEAELLRANTLHVAVDESRALAGYDPNPFNWTGGTRLDICYLRSMRSPSG